MSYKKPEVHCLGDAAVVIQSCEKVLRGFDPDGSHFELQPNYDLDE